MFKDASHEELHHIERLLITRHLNSDAVNVLAQWADDATFTNVTAEDIIEWMRTLPRAEDWKEKLLAYHNENNALLHPRLRVQPASEMPASLRMQETRR